MRKLTLKQHQLAVWAGILAPILFVVIFTVEGFLRSGYSALSMYISALSLGSRGWIQIVNFILFGLLLLVFARGIASSFPAGESPRAGIVLLMIIAALILLSGPFVMDPAGTPQDQMTLHGTVHGIFGGLVFMLMPVSIFTFLRSFRANPKWRMLYWWTLTIGIFDALAVLVFTIASKAPGLVSVFSPWIGLIQRTALIPFMIWLFIFAVTALKQKRSIKS